MGGKRSSLPGGLWAHREAWGPGQGEGAAHVCSGDASEPTRKAERRTGFVKREEDARGSKSKVASTPGRAGL